jgi:hypothetical protein
MHIYIYNLGGKDMKKGLFLFLIFFLTYRIVQCMDPYRDDHRLAFLMGSHPRLGEKAPARVLPPEVRKHILELVRIQEEIDRLRAREKERNRALLENELAFLLFY